jgi:PAS domain S-box-containing protein
MLAATGLGTTLALSRQAVEAVAARLIGGPRQGNHGSRSRRGPDTIPELIVRVRRDGADGTYLEFTGAKRLWPHPDPASLAGERVRNTLPAGVAEAAIASMNRALRTGQVQVEQWRLAVDVDVRTLAAGDGEVLFILRAADDGALEAIFEASPLAIYATDFEGRLTRWNAAAERVFGWSRAEALGRRLPFVPPAGTECDGGAEGLALSAVRKDGRTAEVKLWRAPLANADGSPNGCIAIAADVTEQRAIERQLQEAQRMEAVGRLAGGVAHDFNNLLTVITGYGYMLLEQPEDSAAARGQVEEILRTAERASALTCQLLEFSRPQNGQPRAVAINDLVLDMDKMLRRVIGEHIELVAALSPDAGMIHADAAQIEQVIMNLVVNARDALEAGGRITIETASETIAEEPARTGRPATPGEYAILSVLDNGVGMDEQTKARIFEPFFTTKRQGKGTGLGMATVYAIVKQSRGEIEVTSAPDRGTAIRIYLPRVRPAALEPGAGPEVSHRQRGTETVLVVEDEDEVRRLVSGVLEHHGYTVLPAARPQEAIALCTSHDGAIDLLLTDAVMPQMSGRALAEQAGQMRPNLRVLLMSGYAEDALEGRGLAGAGGAFLRKPFTPTVLTRKIREVLDGG